VYTLSFTVPFVKPPRFAPTVYSVIVGRSRAMCYFNTASVTPAAHSCQSNDLPGAVVVMMQAASFLSAWLHRNMMSVMFECPMSELPIANELVIYLNLEFPAVFGISSWFPHYMIQAPFGDDGGMFQHQLIQIHWQ
jgi:hypothetical protein